MEVLNQRKMTSRLDLLRPSLQGKVHKMQTQMKETHDRKGHERKFTSGECVCQELWARTKMVKNVQSVRLFLLLAFQTNFRKKQTYEVSPVTC